MSSSCSAFVSPVEVARRVSGRPGDEAFLRQLCWRDFYLQLLAARPRLPYDDYRPRGDLWLEDDDAFAAWREGRTGYPIVDAAMRQLLREGWIHSRAQLLAASFLVKDIRLDWRLGAAHFADLLVDGDLASNSGNWQWVAGTARTPGRTASSTRSFRQCASICRATTSASMSRSLPVSAHARSTSPGGSAAPPRPARLPGAPRRPHRRGRGLPCRQAAAG